MSTNVVAAAHFKFAFAYMDRIRRHKQRCDVILISNKVEIGAHKVILASCSLYFHVKFFIEGKENCIIDEIDSDILEKLVDYIYTSKITITNYNVKDLLVASKILMLTEVWKQCLNFMMRTLSLSNCLSVTEWTDNEYPELKVAAEDYVWQHLSKLMECQEFLRTSYQNICQLLPSAKRNSVKAENLLDAILAWIHHDVASRREFLNFLLEYVDLSRIEPDYLMKKLDEPLLKDNLQYMTKAMNALRDHYMQTSKLTCSSTANASNTNVKKVEKTSLLDMVVKSGFDVPLNVELNKSSSTQPKSLTAPSVSSKATKKTANKKTGVLVVAGRNGRNLSVERYDFQKMQWNPVPVTMEDLDDCCGIFFHKKQLFIISGMYKDNVVFYNPGPKRWESAESFGCYRAFMGFCTYGSIFAIGGYNPVQGMSTKAVEVYNAESGKYVGASMSQARHGHGVTIMKGKIYAVGGYFKPFYLKCVECYDPNSKKWTPLPDMLHPRYKPGVGSRDGILYVVGGRNAEHGFLNYVETYNPRTSVWSRLPNMHIKRESPGVIAYDDRIFVVGGFNGAALKSVEMYDPLTNTWTLLPNMKTAKEDVTTLLMESEKSYYV